MKTKGALAVLAILSLGACTADSAKTADTMAVAGDTAMSPAAAAIEPSPPPAAAATGMMDPNTASTADLTVAGVPSAAATALAAGRPYKSMADVDKVLATSLSEQQRDSVYTRIWIPIDLNTATDAEILVIPGVGPRMLREFKEYRPWTSIEQFRREIGKYVDKAELARLEKYVAIN